MKNYVKNRWDVDQLVMHLTLHCIIEKCYEFQVPLAISFINFSEAFDSIQRLYGNFSSHTEYQTSWYVPLRGSTITRVVCAWTEDSYRSWFHVITGAQQGCNHSPLLFAITRDWVLQLATKEWGTAWFKGSCPPDFNLQTTQQHWQKVPTTYKILWPQLVTAEQDLALLLMPRRPKHVEKVNNMTLMYTLIRKRKRILRSFTYIGKFHQSSR